MKTDRDENIWYANEKIVIIIILLCLFILLSIFFIETPAEKTRYQAHSSKLIKTIEHTGNREQMIYRDGNGNIAFASDAGFAIKEVTETRSGFLEEYFDENGTPINRASGYHAILQDYWDNGQKKRTTYLDFDCQPTNNIQGYAIIEYSYDKSGNTVTETYLDKNGLPVCSRDYGYSKRSEYKNGKATKITFLDNEENPMITGLGYAILIRSYYSSEGVGDDEVKEEFYFDEAGNPIAIDLGQYGIHIEYNEIGQRATLTYLDAEGQPIMNRKGYSKVCRTFNDDNSIESEMYYDVNGDPISLSEGQFGKKTENGKEMYLNADGSIQFNMKKLLYNTSYLAIVIALLLVIVSITMSHKVNAIMLFLYIGAIVYMTIMFRENRQVQARWNLFNSYVEALDNPITLSSIIRNIWLFIPVGAFLYRLYPKKIVIVIPILISIMIEIVQLIARIGYCEVDDVVSNTLGALIGYATGKILLDLKCTIKK